MGELTILPLTRVPEVVPGDNLGRLLVEAAAAEGIRFRPRDLLVVTQKVVSKAEGRLVELARVTPSPFSRQLAARLAKDPRLVEVILQESRRIVKMAREILITETPHGLVCANSGVDASNVPPGYVSLLPRDPDRSALQLREEVCRRTGVRVGVVITDTFGRPWRVGLTEVAIGVAGLRPLVDHRGEKDHFGKLLRVTVVAVADHLAAAAGLVMEKAARIPAAVVRGYRASPGRGKGRQLIRPPEEDLFR
ncbi:MAG: coenzyme F420-0:L-glutamate ligase [Deltaproteobacteria bacterium]|nr:coenzyme F420-0:L-glutamate ligase [Deltaproteobacteria bacterium]